MLKQRVITAVVLLPLVIWALLFASNQGFTIGLAVILLLATFEWNHFVNYENKFVGWFFSIVTVLAFVYLEFYVTVSYTQEIIFVALAWWLLSLPLLLKFPYAETHFIHNKAFKIIVGFILILSTFIALNFIRNNPAYGPDYVLYLLIIIWIADTGAYFSGRAWGKHKLIPQVSPGKSWEGVVGAFVVTTLASVIAVNVLNISSSLSIVFILVTLVTVAFSIVGDLSISMFKRMVGLKDSGKLLPGHGGILDRIDSLTSGLPVFLAGLWLMEQLA